MAEKQFRNLELKVGLFIFVSLVIAASIIVFLAIQKNIFTKKIRIQIIAKSGEGLVKGMPVVYSGFQIAKVDELFLREDGRVVLKVKIPINYAKWIKKDSTAKLKTKGILGAGEIVFSGGTGKTIENGTIFTLVRDKGIEQLISEAKPILEDVKEIVKNLKTLTISLNRMSPEWEKLSVGLGNVGEDLTLKRNSVGVLARTNYLTKKIDYLFSKIDRIDKKVNNILSKVDNSFPKIDSALSKTNKLLDTSDILLVNSNKLVLNINDKLNISEPLVKESTKLVKNLRLITDNLSDQLEAMEFLLENTNQILINMQSRWPFSSKNTSKEKLRLKLP